MTRPDEAGDARCEDAYRPGARNQDVLSHQVERQRRVRGVAQGVEAGGDIVGYVVVDLEGVERR